MAALRVRDAGSAERNYTLIMAHQIYDELSITSLP